MSHNKKAFSPGQMLGGTSSRIGKSLAGTIPESVGAGLPTMANRAAQSSKMRMPKDPRAAAIVPPPLDLMWATNKAASAGSVLREMAMYSLPGAAAGAATGYALSPEERRLEGALLGGLGGGAIGMPLSALGSMAGAQGLGPIKRSPEKMKQLIGALAGGGIGGVAAGVPVAGVQHLSEALRRERDPSQKEASYADTGAAIRKLLGEAGTGALAGGATGGLAGYMAGEGEGVLPGAVAGALGGGISSALFRRGLRGNIGGLEHPSQGILESAIVGGGVGIPGGALAGKLMDLQKDAAYSTGAAIALEKLGFLSGLAAKLGPTATKIIENPMARAAAGSAAVGGVAGAAGGALGAPEGQGLSGALKGGLIGAGLGAGTGAAAHKLMPGIMERGVQAGMMDAATAEKMLNSSLGKYAPAAGVTGLVGAGAGYAAS